MGEQHTPPRLLSYDPETQRRCICCSAEGGQYALRDVLGAVFPNDAVVLSCGHIDTPLDVFKALHPDWFSDEEKR